MLSVRVVPRRGVLARALLATTEIMLGTVAAHTWAGGSLPSMAWLAAIAGLVLVASLVVLRGQAPLRVAVPVLAAAQLLLHCWLMTLAPSSGADLVHTGHPLPGAPPMSGIAGMSGMSTDAGHLQLTAPMLAAHLGAALLTALVWGLRRRAVEVLLTWGRAVRVPVPTVRPLASLPLPPYAPVRALLSLPPRRGPPVLLARA